MNKNQFGLTIILVIIILGLIIGGWLFLQPEKRTDV